MDVVSRLQAALAADVSAAASDHLVQTMREVAESAAAEVAAAERLRGCLRSSHADTQEALRHMEATVAQAAEFPRLKVGDFDWEKSRASSIAHRQVSSAG